MIRRTVPAYRLIFWMFVALVFGPASRLGAQTASEPAVTVAGSATGGERAGSTLTVGIAGHYRVGSWTAVRMSPAAAQRGDPDVQRAAESRGQVILETRDGDGVQVRYEQSGSLAAGDWGYVIPGGEAAPLIMRDGQDVIVSTRFPEMRSPARGASMVPLGMPWIVAFGDPLGVDTIGANELLGRDALVAVSRPREPQGYPDSVLGYDGVDMMLIGGSSVATLEELNQRQRQAISEWILGGGRLFLTLGAEGPDVMRAAPWLRALLPLAEGELQTESLNPSAIETYTSSQIPLEPFVGVLLPRQPGTALIMGRTERRETTAFAMEYTAGFGKVTALAADLEAELFVDWPERLDLITRLTGSTLIPRESNPAVTSRATAYDDLAGQMRLTLDQFPIKRTFGFSIISLILMGLIAAIGPLDYLLVNRVLGRPLLGWLSVPLIAVGLSVILMSQSGVIEAEAIGASEGSRGETELADSQLRCNRVEFIDIDSTTGLGRGFSASYLYSHPARLVDVVVSGTAAFERITAQTERLLSMPFGYPGESFGGIQIAIEDARLPTYRVVQTIEEGVLRGTLRGVPLAPRSSKAIATRFSFTPDLAQVGSLTRRPGSLLLKGAMVNPLPVDLLDGMLVYRNWVYLLPTRFPVGARIAALEDLRQKNFRWQLSRQKSLEENVTETEAWDPTLNDSIDRVAEMLMFHDAVGGTRYTSLKHEPLAFLDLTDTLTEDRCMLVARVAEPLTQFQTIDSDEDPRVPKGESLSIIRVLLPVESAAQR